jgi:hypothetical protein
MKITIDDVAINFTLETEKNCFDVIEAVKQWLAEKYITIISLKIDNKEYSTDSKSELENLSIDGISNIDILTITLKELKFNKLIIIQNYFESLLVFTEIKDKIKLFEFLNEYKQIKPIMENIVDKAYNPDNKGFIESIVEKKEIDDISLENLKNFAKSIIFIVEERKKEILNTQEEIERGKKYFIELLPEIEVVSVLLQTGKNQEAIEKIIKFIDFAKKFSRILSYYNMDTNKIELEKISNYNNLLNNLCDSLSRGDSVLTGDILEYELTPVIEEFFEIMTNNEVLEK